MKTLYIILSIITFFFCCGRQLLGQEKVNISAGIGFPELINVGLKYQIFDQAKIGLSIGWVPPYKPETNYLIQWDHMISFSGDFYYYFAGSSKFSDLHPWYGRIGLNCFRSKDWDYYYKQGYLRIGRDFVFEERCGVSLDGGLGLSSNIGWELGEDGKYYYLILTLGGCFFYRF